MRCSCHECGTYMADVYKRQGPHPSVVQRIVRDQPSPVFLAQRTFLALRVLIADRTIANRGRLIAHDPLHDRWVRASATPIDWPGAGKCHMILYERMEDDGWAFFYDAISKSEYNELLELNYARDSYTVVLRGGRAGGAEIRQGTISSSVRRLSLIHI